MSSREQLITELGLDPCLAHATFFTSAHKNLDAPFHRQMERDWHSDIPNILTIAFRGSGKSTKAEEAIALEVGFQRVKNVLILGESETRAAERLAAVMHTFEYNEQIRDIFQVEPGDPWTNTKAVTSTGIMLQAAGRGQSLRGVKYLNERPDYIFLDDVEDKESGSVATPEARRKTRSWLAGTVIPSLAPGGRMRMAATPLHPEALAPTLAKADKSWTTRSYPILYRDPDTGEWRSAWPDRFPLKFIFDRWESFKEIGQEEDFFQEYLCRAVDPSSQVFTEDMFVVEPRARSWHAVYAIYDPARTTNKSSATTGKVVASWIGRKMIVWEASARKWMPDEIVNDIFETDEKYSPVAIGVEENGLNEWLLQPIRSAQIERGTIVPLRALQAPKGKLDFIRGLQPYFRAHEVVFNGDMPELRAQLLGFPTGFIDAPNALAYMLRMKLGASIYDNFREEHIDDDVRVKLREAVWLLINTDNQITTGMAVQMQAGRFAILGDVMVEGDAGTALTEVLTYASLLIAGPSSSRSPKRPPQAQDKAPQPVLRLLSPAKHFDDYTIYGLRAAVRKLGREVSRGGPEDVGREELRGLLRRAAHGRPALAVRTEARWTLRAFSGGYVREVGAAAPLANPYAVLMEPLEGFASLMRIGAGDVLDTRPNYAYTEDGRRYISALAR
jgi:hypothetical protein